MHFHNNYTVEEKPDLSRFDNEQDYLCSETRTTTNVVYGSTDDKEEVLSDIVTQDSFSTGETRVTVIKKTDHGQRITTTRICSAKNPSYLTWKNGTLVLTTAAALGLGTWATSQGLNWASPSPIIETPWKNKYEMFGKDYYEHRNRMRDKALADESYNRQVIWDALEGSDEYAIDYNGKNKHTGKNIATGFTPEENTEFAPYVAGALAAGAGGLAGGAYLSSAGLTAAEAARIAIQGFGRMSGQNAVSPITNTTSKAIVPYISPKVANSTLTNAQIAKTIGKNTAFNTVGGAILHSGLDYYDNGNTDNTLQAATNGALTGAIIGTGFGIGSVGAQAAGLGLVGTGVTELGGAVTGMKAYDAYLNN